jgi:hypothetical protein
MMDPVSEPVPHPGGHDRQNQMCGHDAGGAGPPQGASPALLGDPAAILGIAEELERPLAEITRVYCEELAHLRSQATVLDYLPVFVAKRVRALYRKLRARAPEMQG